MIQNWIADRVLFWFSDCVNLATVKIETFADSIIHLFIERTRKKTNKLTGSE